MVVIQSYTADIMLISFDKFARDVEQIDSYFSTQVITTPLLVFVSSLLYTLNHLATIRNYKLCFNLL